MIAVISSTIYPPSHHALHSRGKNKDRLEQTKNTVKSLVTMGVSQIYLADNSGERREKYNNELLNPAKINVYDLHQYKNKGISEL